MASTPTHKNLSSLVEQPDSGRIESAAQRRMTKTYIATRAVALAALKTKGTLGSGDTSGYVLESSTYSPRKGDQALLTDVWVAGGDDADPESTPLPPDEVGVSGTNQGPRIERHPRYVSLTAANLLLVDKAVKSPLADERAAAYADLSATGRELVDKIRKGNESYYLATLRYSWATHSFTIPSSTRGGYVDTISGPLASYFVGSISWLREADDLQLINGIWRLTSSWLGADSWDAQIYA